MKKIIYSIIIGTFIFLLSGCSESATMAVENYLAKYNALDTDVISDMKTIVDKENLTNDNKEIYESIFEKQYTDLKYEIVEEEYDGDEATVEVKITVYDLYKVQNDATKYLAEHPEDFNDENGVYSVDKYIEYKLNKMKNSIDKVDYTIEFYVVKTKDGWVVSPLSNTDLEKIHGVYNYESQ